MQKVAQELGSRRCLFRDPDNDRLIEVVLAAHVDSIVTAYQDVLTLERVDRISIVTLCRSGGRQPACCYGRRCPSGTALEVTVSVRVTDSVCNAVLRRKDR